MEIISRNKKLNKKDLFKHTIFRTVREPIIKIKNSINEHSLHSAIRRRKNDIENYFNKISVKLKYDLINDDNFQKRKKNNSPQIKKIISNSIIKFSPFSEKKKSTKNILKKKKNFSETFSSLTNYSTDKNTDNVTKENSNFFLTNIKEKENSKEKKTSFKTFKSNVLFRKRKYSFKVRNIRLFIDNHNSEKSKSSPKKILLNSNTEKNITQEKNIFHSQSNFNSNILDNNLRKNNLTYYSDNKKRKKSIYKKLMEIEKKNELTNNQLKKLFEEEHFFPIVSNSFKSDISDIIDKTIEIRKNGTYQIKSIYQNDKFKKMFDKYWDYNNKKITHNAFKERQQKLWNNISGKLQKDIDKAEKMNINIKYESNSSINYLFFKAFEK